MITALRELVGFDLPIAALRRRAPAAGPEGAAELLGSRLLAHLPVKE